MTADATGSVTPVTDADFAEVVLRADRPVFVDFWAEWCTPCKQIAPIIEELAAQYAGRVRFVRMDTNANPVTPADQRVLGLPALHVYRDGALVTAFKGSKSKATLIDALEECLQPPASG